MLLTIKGCTFQFTLNLITYIHSLPLPISHSLHAQEIGDSH